MALPWLSSSEFYGAVLQAVAAPSLKRTCGLVRKPELLQSSSSGVSLLESFRLADGGKEAVGFRAASQQKAVLCHCLPPTKAESLLASGAATSSITSVGPSAAASELDTQPILDEQERITGCLQVGIFNYRRPGSWVCFGGGERPKTRRVWKTKTRKGTIAKSTKLITLINSLSNVKEEVYGALDAWIAWELEFPLITVKKALKTLQSDHDWKRVIQVSKWMLSKGQGKTIGTYQLLLEAFEEEGRLEEAEALWIKVFEENLQCVPRVMFTRIISMYERSGEFEKLLDVFADMEELQVKPDAKIVKIVARTYKKIGMPDKQEKVLKKYPFSIVKGCQERIDVNETEHHDEEIAEEAMNEYSRENTRETSQVLTVQGSEDASKSPVVASF